MKEENIKSEYQRKVDKSLIPTCNIMGVNIAAINMNWLLKYLDALNKNSKAAAEEKPKARFRTRDISIRKIFKSGRKIHK